MIVNCDIAIVGSGFAGSLLAMIARRLGRSVVLLEKGTHPRVVTGESSTPLSNLLLEELAVRYDLPALRPLTKWGSWQRSYPDIACGLKRGFTFYHHAPGQEPATDPMRRDQLLVAASPRDEIADTHWYRADLDHMMVREAQKCGADYIDRAELSAMTESTDAVLLEGMREGRAIAIRAKFVIDATGPQGFIHRALGLSHAELSDYPATQCLYSHFEGVRRFDELLAPDVLQAVPYPIDDAAVHHIFDGGWIWVLRFNNGVTSAGVAVANEAAARLRIEDGSRAWSRVLDSIPALKSQFAHAKPIRPFTHMPRMSFRSSRIIGERWALLPSAAGFVDPLMSTGIALTLLGVSRLSQIIEDDWDTARFNEHLDSYAAITDRELSATSRLVAALYANMNNFPVFTALTTLYFAAASFSETARRLGKPELASSFLLCDDADLGPAFINLTERACSPLSKAQSDQLIEDISIVIEPINVAGLCRPDRRNWYPVEADDLLKSASKLGVDRQEISDLLFRCGFAREAPPVPSN